MRVALAALFLGAMLSGCVGTDGNQVSPFASESTVVSRKALAIPAGSTYHVDFQADGRASYSFQLTDDSSVAVGFIQTQDINEYNGGTAVYTYAYHKGVKSATDSAVLSGAYSFVIHCENAFLDCDGLLDYLKVTN